MCRMNGTDLRKSLNEDATRRLKTSEPRVPAKAR